MTDLQIPVELQQFSDVLTIETECLIPLVELPGRYNDTVFVHPGPFARSRLYYWLEAEEEEHRRHLEAELVQVQEAWKRFTAINLL